MIIIIKVNINILIIYIDAQIWFENLSVLQPRFKFYLPNLTFITITKGITQNWQTTSALLVIYNGRTWPTCFLLCGTQLQKIPLSILLNLR